MLISSKNTATDIARSFALLGMIIVNFKNLAFPANDSSWLSWFLDLAQGRGAALFVVLGGFCIALATTTTRQSYYFELFSKTRTMLIKRAVFLFALGLILAQILPAELLRFYGIYLLVGALMLMVGSRQLMFVAATVVLLFVILVFVFDYDAGWNWNTRTYTEMWTIVGFFRHLFFNGFYSFVPWVSFFLLGMWLGRYKMETVKTRRFFLRRSVIVALSLEIFSMVFIQIFGKNSAGELNMPIRTLFGTASIPPLPLFMVAAGATSIAIICLSYELSESNRYKTAAKTLVFTGQMALTIYVGHILLGVSAIRIFGLDRQSSVVDMLFLAIVYCAVSYVFVIYWKGKHSLGPVEKLMRYLTR